MRESEANLENFLGDVKLEAAAVFQDISGIAEMAWDRAESYDIHRMETEWELRSAVNTIQEMLKRIDDLLHTIHDIVQYEIMGDESKYKSLKPK